MKSDLELTNKEIEKTQTENRMFKNEVLKLTDQVTNRHDKEQYSRRDCQDIKERLPKTHTLKTQSIFFCLRNIIWKCRMGYANYIF